MSSKFRPANALAAALVEGAARAARPVLAAAALAGALAACSTVESVLPETYSDLPESPDVESAPYPRLIDSPTTVAQSDIQTNAAKGQAIQGDINADAAELLEAEAAMQQRKVVADTGLASEAAALRAEAAKVDARQ